MSEDTYWPSPQAPYEERRKLYLEYCAAHPESGRTGFFSQLARLELGQGPLDEDSIRAGIAFIDSRQDCCDFSVGGMLRILYRYPNSPLLSRELKQEIEACLLRFKYWWDEPGDNKRCYWTENHQIIFHSDELLAGQLFKQQVFSNDGKSGQAHLEHALRLIRRWFDFRTRFGFSEWLSNCYFEEDLLALVNLHDFAEQPEIRRHAGGMIDLILFEMALHTYRGVMGCSHGRTYTRLILGGRTEDSASTAKLMLGMGLFNKSFVLGGVPLVTSDYRVPEIIPAIAQDLDKPLLIKERHSFNMEDAPSHGLSYDSLEDGSLYWSVQDYTHPSILPVSLRIREQFGVWFENYEPRYEQVRRWQTAKYGQVVDDKLECHAMTEVHIQTYRTGNYLLSCAQDFRPGKPGYQQHPWQATLGIDAVMFTNHPGAADFIARPNYWAGNGVLPRAAQHHNVLVALHSVPPDDAFPFSHAYFPREAFDEVVEQNGWVCARHGGGYLAVHISVPYCWLPDDKGHVVELRAEAPDAAWVVEMGEQGQWADFGAFVQAVTGAALRCEGLSVEYDSPTQGRVVFGWEGDLQVNGQAVPLHNYPRFDNPYAQTPFTARVVEINRGAEKLVLDFSDTAL